MPRIFWLACPRCGKRLYHPRVEEQGVRVGNNATRPSFCEASDHG